MNKIKKSLFAKIIAFVLLVFFAFNTLFSGICSFIALDENYYTKTKADVTDRLYSDISNEVATFVYHGCYSDLKGKLHVSYGHNFNISELADFIICNGETGEVLHISSNPVKTGYLSTQSIYFKTYSAYYSSALTGEPIKSIEIKVMLKPFAKNSILDLRQKLIIFCYENRFLNLVLCLISGIFSIILFAFLLASAGWKKGEETLKTSWLEKIPFDVLTVIIGASILGVLLLCISIAEVIQINALNYLEPLILRISAIALMLFICGSLFVIWAMSLAKRYKAKNILKPCVTYRILRFLYKKFKSVAKFIIMLLKNLKLVWKVVLFIVAVTAFELIFSIAGDEVEYYVFLSILEKLFFIPVVIFISILLQRLKSGGKSLADGNIENKIDTEYMFGDFKEHAENLNSIGEGVAIAVEEKLKSERFKTELITNVSHDIKTPLTSVINYVDLIKGEKPVGEKINEYINVLERQSNRLKKLVEDLVEASKASSGNISVKLVPCDGNILLEQAAGEYAEKFKSVGLNLIIKKPNDSIKIAADVRHLGRVFDNLLNNIYKHAMPDSRVYLSLEKVGEIAVFTFKNISKYELEISGEELAERFVRADKSRNTEGSGLGLSIAKSLTELQNGKFNIVTDGDLFKVILSFNAL